MPSRSWCARSHVHRASKRSGPSLRRPAPRKFRRSRSLPSPCRTASSRPHVCQKVLGGVEAARRILGGLDAGIGQAEERDVGGHCFPSSYGSRQRIAHCYFLRAPSSRLEQRNRAKRRDRLAASRGDPCRPPIRPIEPFAVVTRYVWFTSSIPAGR